MICIKCHEEVPDMPFCGACGASQSPQTRQRKKRGNGQGSVYKIAKNKYKAVATLGYYNDESGKKHRQTQSAVFSTKKDAIAALPELSKRKPDKKKTTMTFRELYDKWLPTHRAGKDTMNCYKAAMKHFRDVWYLRMDDIDVDDLQECLDNCGHGKRTQQNMKALCGLMYKFGIPRHATPNNLNLAQFLVVGGDNSVHRESFSTEQIEKIRTAVDVVPYADYIYCMIYTGFRPSEFLSLDAARYDPVEKCFTGGGKTEAGTNRFVTVSPKIQPVIDRLTSGKESGPVFCDSDGKQIALKDFTEKCFYPALDAIGIDNPMVEIAGGVKRHKFTPHSCRHTFATLMKNINAPSVDKQALIGHASDEMLRYYQDCVLDDLRKITDAI